MKLTCAQTLLSLAFVVAIGGANAAERVDFRILHQFSVSDGLDSAGAMVTGQDGALYGVMSAGGYLDPETGEGFGTVFRQPLDGTPFSVIYAFKGGSDGSEPAGRLALAADGSFLGTTRLGGIHGCGAIFKIDSSGSYKIIHSLDPLNDGCSPTGGVTLGSDNMFYGMLRYGPTLGRSQGIVYRVDIDGNFKIFHSFHGGGNAPAYPNGELARGAAGIFYGATAGGGHHGNSGTLFKISSSGKVNPLHLFSAGEGCNPNTPILAGDGRLYGTTKGCGPIDNAGTVYAVTLTGQFSGLHAFSDAECTDAQGALTEGLGGIVYGTATTGRFVSTGCIFSLTFAGQYSSLKFPYENVKTPGKELTSSGGRIFGNESKIYNLVSQ